MARILSRARAETGRFLASGGAVREARLALWAALGVSAFAAALHTFNSIFIDERVLSYSGELTIPNTLSGLLFLAAGGVGLLAMRADAGRWPIWAVLAAVLLAFGLEEAALDLHNALEDRVEDAAEGLKPVLLVTIPLAGALILYLVRKPLRELPWPVPGLLLSAGGMLIFAQLNALLANALKGKVFEPRNILVLGEEGGEMLAASLALAATVAGWRLAGRERGP